MRKLIKASGHDEDYAYRNISLAILGAEVYRKIVCEVKEITQTEISDFLLELKLCTPFLIYIFTKNASYLARCAGA